MKAKKLFCTTLCLLLAAAYTFSLSGCKKGKTPSGPVSPATYSTAFGKFGDQMSEFDIESPGYDNNAAIDSILNSIINSSAFEGLNNQLTLMGFKNNIYSNELTLSEFIKFDELYADESGNITIETDKGTLNYTKDEQGNVSAKFASSKIVEEEDYPIPTPYNFEATCECYAATKENPESTVMKISYQSGEVNYVSATLRCTFEKDGSLKYKSGTVSSSVGTMYPEEEVINVAFSKIIDAFECNQPANSCYKQIEEKRADMISEAYDKSNGTYVLKP